MSSVTLVLAIFVISLAAGNAMLYLLKNERQKVSVFDMIKQGSEREPVQESVSAPVVWDKKLELAHVRLHGLEKEVRSMRMKVEKLDNFRPTIESEIIGLKEAVGDLKTWSLRGGVKKVAKAKDISADISTEEMRKLIYKSAQN